MTMRRRLVWMLAVVLAAPVALYAVGWAYFVAGPSADDLRHRLPFDAEGWRRRSADTEPEWPTRLRMVDSLIDRKLLDGLNRAQVERLLGPADHTAYFKEWDLVYRLGPERGWMSIDSEWLVVRFDARGAVATYRIVRD